MGVALQCNAVERDARGARSLRLDEDAAAAGRSAVIADHAVQHVEPARDVRWQEPDCSRGPVIEILHDAILDEQRRAIDKVDAGAEAERTVERQIAKPHDDAGSTDEEDTTGRS